MKQGIHQALLFILGALLAIGLQWPDQVRASSVANNNDTNKIKLRIFATEYREQLVKQDMIDHLNHFESNQVARILSQTKDKTDTAVCNGVTVGQLLAQNEVVLQSDCNRTAFRRRVALCERTKNFSKINSYCRRCLSEAAKLCTDKIDDNESTDHTDQWLLGLARVARQIETKEFGFRRTPLEYYITEDQE